MFESPGRCTSVTVTLDEAGRLHYGIERNGVLLLEKSRLGLTCSDRTFDDELRVITPPQVSTIESDYVMGHGKHRAHHVQAILGEISIENTARQHMILQFHVSDQTVAFRYYLPDDGEELTLNAELTTFRFAMTGRAWMQPTSPADGGGPAHENLYSNGVPIGSATSASSWDLPATIETQGQWLLISESDLDESFHGTRLAPHPEGLAYAVTGPAPEEGMGRGSVRPSAVTPWTSPWRFLSLADSAADLIESTAVWDLATPSRLKETSWIRPGRVSWSWWSENDSTKDLDSLRRFIDFAAEMNWEYSLVDANWNVHDEDDIRSLVDYAAERGIRIFLWYNSAGNNNDSTEGPRDLMHESASRRAEMAKIAEWGVAGIKVDFFHSDKQLGIAHYLGIVSDAADAGLMVNLHGSTIPRGWDRTWPNLLTMEAVRGAEWYLFEPRFADEAVWHNTILPFTRNVIGSMDYTPITFSDKAAPRKTTSAHEIALSVVFESALQHFADSPSAYLAQPSEVRELLSAVPASWDETIGLAGEPGDSVVLARRNGDEWWIAGINAAAKDKTPLDLTRLGDVNGTWQIFSDGSSRDDVNIRRMPSHEEFLRPSAPIGGGFLARLLRD